MFYKQHPFEQVKFFLEHITNLTSWLSTISDLKPPICGGRIEYTSNHLANSEALISNTPVLIKRWYILQRNHDDIGGNDEWCEILNQELIRRSGE